LKVLAKIIEGVDPKSLRDTIDQLRNKLGTSVVILAAVNDGKIALAVGVSSDVTSRIKAGNIMKHLAGQVGGKGGGRPDMAQGSGSDLDALPGAINGITGWVEENL